MRRTSQSRLQTQMSEPLIVVEESENLEVEEQRHKHTSSENSSSEGSPTNPYLLSPWRQEIRKHSLPTPQCSGITASQVRRLSERSGESAAQSAREAAFLATLSTNPVSSPGGRRHSVVTISKVPSGFVGRNRRESVAAFPSGVALAARILPGRRESFAGPPSTEPRGSLHNLHLDIMDDIVRARKVRMKMWNTSSEKVCELQPLDADDKSGVQRYTNPSSATTASSGAPSSSGRRYSDFVGTTLAPIPSCSKRRASELPGAPGVAPSSSSATATPPPSGAVPQASSKLTSTGIVCSNTDLISILSSLASSSTEINQFDGATTTACPPPLPPPPPPQLTTRTPPPPPDRPALRASADTERRRNSLKSNRSNSFDMSTLRGRDLRAAPAPPADAFPKAATALALPPSAWFARRHQPASMRTAAAGVPAPRAVSFAAPGKSPSKLPSKLMWDERSGSIVDPHLLGSAIEGFLRRVDGDAEAPAATTSQPSAAGAACKGVVSRTLAKIPMPGSGSGGDGVGGGVGSKVLRSGWFSGTAKGGEDVDRAESCDASSICSTLKDLFVK